MLKRVGLATLLSVIFSLLPAVGMPALAGQFSCEAPVLITSAGQSMEVKMVTMLCNKIGLDNKCDSLAPPAMLNGKKTLLIVPGVSLKGMGTAGVDIGSENSRIAQLSAKAHQKGARVLVVHTGGAIRRGPVNDPVIEKTLAGADFAVVCREGNEDKFFTTKCRELDIPLLELENISNLPGTLKTIFSPE